MKPDMKMTERQTLEFIGGLVATCNWPEEVETDIYRIIRAIEGAGIEVPYIKEWRERNK